MCLDSTNRLPPSDLVRCELDLVTPVRRTISFSRAWRLQVRVELRHQAPISNTTMPARKAETQGRQSTRHRSATPGSFREAQPQVHALLDQAAPPTLELNAPAPAAKARSAAVAEPRRLDPSRLSRGWRACRSHHPSCGVRKPSQPSSPRAPKYGGLGSTPVAASDHRARARPAEPDMAVCDGVLRDRPMDQCRPRRKSQLIRHGGVRIGLCVRAVSPRPRAAKGQAGFTFHVGKGMPRTLHFGK